jgi:hypothetical protein
MNYPTPKVAGCKTVPSNQHRPVLQREAESCLCASPHRLVPLGILTFSSGFFPYKPLIPGLATFDETGENVTCRSPFCNLTVPNNSQGCRLQDCTLKPTSTCSPNLLVPLGILTFSSGFFPYKPLIPGLATFDETGENASKLAMTVAQLQKPILQLDCSEQLPRLQVARLYPVDSWISDF